VVFLTALEKLGLSLPFPLTEALSRMPFIKKAKVVFVQLFGAARSEFAIHDATSDDALANHLTL
jgi:hypothetical protein